MDFLHRCNSVLWPKKSLLSRACQSSEKENRNGKTNPPANIDNTRSFFFVSL